MAEYTYKDIIIDPTSEEAGNAVGKECYFGDSPTYCVNNANSDHFLYVLRHIEAHSMQPFVDMNFNAYGCIIVKKREPYTERESKWIEENNLKVGDYVKVTRTAVDYEDGWGYVWDYRMDLSVGKILRVKGLEAQNGFIALEDSFGYPYFVLEKVEEPKSKYVPFTSKEEFIEAFHYHDNAKYSETEDILMNYGMWLKSKDEGYFVQVWIITTSGIQTEYSLSAESWEDLLANYTFLDGSPCGKSKEN